MAASLPATVARYLSSLPAAARREVEAVRTVIQAHLDSGFEEGILYGMIGYYVPHHLYPAGYHCDPRQPLPLAILGAKKNHLSLHLMPLYGDTEFGQWFRAAAKKAGGNLDIGKACIRFRTAADMPRPLLREAFDRLSAKEYIAMCEASLTPAAKAPRKAPVNKRSAARRSS